jgi:hypothetical protein
MSEKPDTVAKTPSRPAGVVIADIESERAALAATFEALRRDLDELLDAGARRAADAGRKARVVAPVVAGVAVTLGTMRILIRRRAKKAG